MIIQCEQCQAKFRLDDSKIKDKGVKVRCAKCKHLFTVTKEQPREEQPPAGSVAAFGQNRGDFQEDTAFSPPSPPQPLMQEPAGESPFASGMPADDVFGGSAGLGGGSPDESMPQDGTFMAAGADEFTPFGQTDETAASPVQQDSSAAAPGEFDFGGFDFGESAADGDKPPVAQPRPDAFDDAAMKPKTVPVEEIPQKPDFSGDDMFGGIIPPPTAMPAEPAPLDFGAVTFPDASGMGDTGAGQPDAVPSPREDALSFNPAELSFGDEPVPMPAPEVRREESQPPAVAPAAPPRAEAVSTAPPVVADALGASAPETAPKVEQDELPPLSIASRRKQSPLLRGLFAIVALLVVGALGYFGLTSLSDDKEKAAQEAGRISVRAIKAAYVKNASAGNLLVVSGEAVNEYPKSRASLQVKGVVFDAKGQVLASRNAYAGNILTPQQLGEMTMEKIQAAMANRYGADTLANLDVGPGKAIPFMIVIANPPGDGKDVGVEPAGSAEVTSRK